MKQWLKNGVIMAHTVDFTSQGTAVRWNGQSGYSDFVWDVIRGRAPYVINREPLSRHVQYLKDLGFDQVRVDGVTREDGIDHDRVHSKCNYLSESDLKTSGAYMIFRKWS